MRSIAENLNNCGQRLKSLARDGERLVRPARSPVFPDRSAVMSGTIRERGDTKPGDAFHRPARCEKRHKHAKNDHALRLTRRERPPYLPASSTGSGPERDPTDGPSGPPTGRRETAGSEERKGLREHRLRPGAPVGGSLSGAGHRWPSGPPRSRWATPNRLTADRPPERPSGHDGERREPAGCG